MLTGTALRTIAPAHMPNREIEQGLGQFDAPLNQHNTGVGSIVAPTEILPLGQMARQNEPDLHGQGQMHLVLGMPHRPKDLTYMGRGRIHLNRGMMPQTQGLVRSIRGGIT